MEESESIKSSDDDDSILDSNSDTLSKSSSSGVDDSDWSEADEILDKSDMLDSLKASDQADTHAIV